MSRRRPEKQPHLVILRALALGDLLTALPALRALRRAFPSHRHILTCPRWLTPLAQLIGVADEFIEGAYFEEENGHKSRYKIPTDLRLRIELEQAQLNGLRCTAETIDIAVNLRGERIATHRALLALKPRRLIGFYNSDVPETAGSPVWLPNEHEVARWCRLLRENGIPTDPDELHFTPPAMTLPDIAKGAVVVHPGAGSPARYWPVERWADVARWEKQRGNRVIVTGGPHEVDMAERLAALAGLSPEAVLAGRTNTLELAAICSSGKRILCTDTGIAHLAVALCTPSIALFGPMPPARWGPPQHFVQHRVLWAGITGEPYAPSPDEGLLKITVEDVLSEIIDLEKDGY